jgi:hypothetical protein
MFLGVAPRVIPETEEIPAYELTIAKGGLKIKPSQNLAKDHPATGTESWNPDEGRWKFLSSIGRRSRRKTELLVAQRNQRSHFRCPPCGYPASEQRNCSQQ